MLKDQSLLRVDFKKQAGVLQLVPRSPIISSEEACWSNLLVQHHQQPAWEMPENTQAQHVIAVHWMENRTPVKRVMDETNRQDYLGYRSCVIVPANVPHQSAWNHDVEFTLLILEPTYLAQIAHESIDGDRVELTSQFDKADSILSGIAASLKKELETDGIGAKMYAESATTFLAAHLLRRYCTRTQPLHSYVGGLPKYKLREAIAYIQEHLGEEISLEAIATHLNMSQYYFCHLFKQSMGVSPYQYVLQQRVNKAKQLLKHRLLTITDVALECGFANQTHFTKHFRKLTGVTPKVYREQ